VRKAVVRVEKPGAVAEAASVGVEVKRARPARVKKEAGKVGQRGKNPKKV
jgi:hypothetical protein